MSNSLVTQSNVEVVEESARKIFSLTNEEKEQIDKDVKLLMESILSVDHGSAKSRISVVDKIDGIGNNVVKQSTVSCQLPNVQIKDLAKSKDKDESPLNSQEKVLNGIEDLNEEMKKLDPSRVNFSDRGFFGRTASSIRKYFAKYEKADAVIKNILSVLENGKVQLESDNKVLEMKQVEIRNLTRELSKLVEYTDYLQVALTEKIEESKNDMVDEETISFLESQVLFAVLQKNQDLRSQLTVNQQGYIAIEIIKRNNLELVRNVRRATTTTISALSTAVMVSSALYNQNIVLKQINAVNVTTDNMIKNTSELLKTQGVAIQKLSVAGTGPSVETLKEAFRNTFEAMDQIEQIRRSAIPLMKERVKALDEVARTGESYIRKYETMNKS